MNFVKTNNFVPSQKGNLIENSSDLGQNLIQIYYRYNKNIMKKIYITLCILQTILLFSFILNKDVKNVETNNVKIEKVSPKFLPLYEKIDTTKKTYSI